MFIKKKEERITPSKIKQLKNYYNNELLINKIILEDVYLNLIYKINQEGLTITFIDSSIYQRTFHKRVREFSFKYELQECITEILQLRPKEFLYNKTRTPKLNYDNSNPVNIEDVKSKIHKCFETWIITDIKNNLYYTNEDLNIATASINKTYNFKDFLVCVVNEVWNNIMLITADCYNKFKDNVI